MGKYSFDTTIGDIMDNPETLKLLAELAPEAINHPMIEIGRPFSINQALPFIEGIAAELNIDNFDERVATFKEKLEALE